MPLFPCEGVPVRGSVWQCYLPELMHTLTYKPVLDNTTEISEIAVRWNPVPILLPCALLLYQIQLVVIYPHQLGVWGAPKLFVFLRKKLCLYPWQGHKEVNEMPPRLTFSIRFVGVSPNYLLTFSGPGTLKSLPLKVQKVGVKIATDHLEWTDEKVWGGKRNREIKSKIWSCPVRNPNGQWDLHSWINFYFFRISLQAGQALH